MNEQHVFELELMQRRRLEISTQHRSRTKDAGIAGPEVTLVPGPVVLTVITGDSDESPATFVQSLFTIGLEGRFCRIGPQPVEAIATVGFGIDQMLAGASRFAFGSQFMLALAVTTVTVCLIAIITLFAGIDLAIATEGFADTSNTGAGTEVVTLSTVCIAGFEIDTEIAANSLTSGTIDDTLTFRADTSTSTLRTTLATIVTVILKVNADIVTNGLVGGTNRFAGATGADLTSFAANIAEATVLRISFQILANTKATVLTARTATTTANTEIAASAFVATGTAVAVVVEDVDTGGSAEVGRTARTDNAATTGVTLLCWATGRAALSAVVAVFFEIHTNATAESLTGGTGTLTVGAVLTAFAGHTAFAAVSVVGFRVDASTATEQL